MESKKIGNKIAEARKRINISQAELSQRLFISPQAVGKWERGESMPDIITFNRIAEILGVDLNYFSENFHTATSEAVLSTDTGKSGNLQSRNTKNKPGWDMSSSNWVDADFSGLKNLHEKFNSSNMLKCLFVGSEMSGLLLKNNNVAGCDFTGSDFSKSNIMNSNLADNKFNDCTFKETEFSGSYISGCDFSSADFTGVEIKSGGLEKNIFSNTVWDHTSFTNTHIVDTVLEGVVEDCSFENCAFTKVIFQNATLLNTFFKNNRKLKKVRFIDCKADKITYAFLKNNLADLTGVTILAE